MSHSTHYRLSMLAIPLFFVLSSQADTRVEPERKANLEASREKWSAVAIADIQRAHETIRDSHPAVLEPANLDFQAWFKQGYDQAMALARRAESEAQAKIALDFYTTGYKNEHITAWKKRRGKAPPPQWAGWAVQYRNGKYLVTTRAADWPIDVPQRGDEVLSCDGKSIDELLVEKVAPFVDRRTELENTRSALALHLTLEQLREPLWEPLRLKHCEVRTVAGALRRFDLQWQPQPARLSIAQRVTQRQGIEQIRLGIHWIHVSDFMLEDEEFAELEQLLAKIRDLNTAEAVVLDMRGNGGGNSLVGYRILFALMKEGRHHANTAKAYWRVSTLARETLEAHRAAALRMEGRESQMYRIMDSFLSSMNAAAQRDEPMVEQPQVPVDSTQEALDGLLPFKGKLVLLTDSGCGSACLDFVEAVLSIPRVVHVGATTSADTRYTDVATVKLPSGARLRVPLKVYKNRTRADNVPYVPQIAFEGDLNDSKAVRAWVLDTILPTAQKISIP